MRRSLSLFSEFVVVLLLAGVTPPLPLAAQTASPASHSPDLLGIYTGMPADQAKAQLQKHSSDVYVQYASNAAEGFGLSVPGIPQDQISVSVTQPPNVPAVWRVERYQAFFNQKPLSRNALLDALHQKYGKETFSRTPDAGHVQLYWIYDANGQPRPHADPGLTARNAVVPSNMTGELARRCAQDFFALYIAILSAGTDGDSVQSYTLVLINLPYAAHAAKLTTDGRKAADDQAPKKPAEKVPTF